MKATTLQQRIEKKLYTKEGKLATRFANLDTLLIEGIWHGKKYSSRGRFITLTNGDHLSMIEALRNLGIDFKVGNDAPRGGGIDDYVALTEKGKRQVKEYADIKRAEREAQRAAELAQREAERKAATEREAQYQAECEATYNLCKERGVSFDWQDSNWRWVPCFNHSKNEIDHGTINKIIYHELAIVAGVKNNKGWRKYVDEVVQSKFEPEFIQRKSR